MARPILIISIVVALIVLGSIDYLRPVRTGTDSYNLGLERGEIAGHNAAEGGAPKLTGEAKVNSAQSDLPWSIKLNWPHAISEYVAGWSKGYEVGYHFRTPRR